MLDYYRLLEHFEIIEKNYRFYHRQIHWYDEQLRYWNGSSIIGMQQSMEQNRRWRLHAVEKMEEQRVRWWEALEEVRGIDERVSLWGG